MKTAVTTAVKTAARTATATQLTALIIGARADQRGLATLVHTLGFDPVHATGSDALPASDEGVALCLIGAVYFVFRS